MGEKKDIRRATRIQGMWVWPADQEEDFGRVKALVFDATGRHLVGFWVKPWDVMRRRRGLLLADVKRFGQSRLRVESAKSLAGATRFGRLRDGQGRFVELLGLPAGDESGESLGHVVDATIDVSTGEVRTLEVSRGLVADITSRPFRFRPSAVVEVKPDAIVLRGAEALPEPKKPRSKLSETAEEVAGVAGRAAGKGYVKARTAWRRWVGPAAPSGGKKGKAGKAAGK